MVATLNRELTKIHRNLSGIREMTRLPDAIVVVDPKREHIAVKEAQRMGVATVALIDTDSDPDVVDLPIPGNDDSIRSIELMLGKLADAVLEGKAASAGRDAAARPGRGRGRTSPSSGGREAGARLACNSVNRAEPAASLTKHDAPRPPAGRVRTIECLRRGFVMAITAAAVDQLRKRTGMQMMKCKAALIEANGDMEKAVEILRKSNKDAQDKVVNRETAEGRIGVYIDPARADRRHRRGALRERPGGQERPVHPAGDRPGQADRR